MASMKLLGKKREKLIAPIFETDSKEDSTQSSNPYSIFDVKYMNFKEPNLKENPFGYWDGKIESNHQPKLNDEKFKNKKYFNFSSKKTEKLAPLKSKATNYNSLLKNEREYLYHFLKMKNYSINELKQINLLKNIPEKKFHMILDIDSTLVKTVSKSEIPSNPKPDDFEISGSIDSRNNFEFYCRYRPFLFNFIHEMKDYFQFYISTLGHINYANKIIEDLIKRAEISLPEKNIVSNASPGQKLVKSLREIKSLSNIKDELDDTVIIDDVINYWINPPNTIKPEDEIKQCIKCLIPCKRYVINSAKGPDAENFGILIHYNILEENYNKALNYSIPVDYYFCVEKDKDSENGRKGQFYYLEIFIKNCIKLCLYTGCKMVEAMDFFRKKVFENCKFNLKNIDSKWMNIIIQIIKDLGGEIVVNINETTHFIVMDEIKSEDISKLKKNQYVININYIFQCYFNLYRMNESENQGT